jgi:hypothetical protein
VPDLLRRGQLALEPGQAIHQLFLVHHEFLDVSGAGCRPLHSELRPTPPRFIGRRDLLAQDVRK